MRLKLNNMDLVKRYAELLQSVFNENLVSVFLFGSVARGEDTEASDIDIMAIVNDPPAMQQVRKLGKIGRFDEIRGRGEFQKISCVAVSQDRFLELLKERAPREAVNPLREAVVLYDAGFVAGLKEEVESGAISLNDDAFVDYLRYGDIRRSCLVESAGKRNKRDACSDAVKAATHYLRAYILYKYNEMVLSREVLKARIKEEDNAVAVLYGRIIEGDYDIDLVENIRDWVIKKIGAAEDRSSCIGRNQ